MGNKSKQRAKPGMWKSVRDLPGARQVRSVISWQGLASPTAAPLVSVVGISATDTERAHPLRQRHGRTLLRRVA